MAPANHHGMRSGRLRALEHRAVHGALLAAAILVATVATAAIRGEGGQQLSTEDRADRSTTTTTVSTTSTTALPVEVPVAGVAVQDEEAERAPVGPSGTEPGGAGGSGVGLDLLPTTTTTAPPPPPPPPPPDLPSGQPGPPAPCGGTVPKHGGGEWQCVFSDEFDGSELDRSKWMVFETAKTGWHSGQECMVDRPENVSVADGTLRLTARQEAQGFTCTHPQERRSYPSQQTSGMVSTWGKDAWQYGRMEIRAAFPDVRVPGVHSALWLWPDNPYAHLTWTTVTGEIDIAEYYSYLPDRVVPYLHHTPLGGEDSNNECLIDAPGKFHDYVLTWTADLITIYYDGNECVTQPLTHGFHEPFFLNLTQALGIGRKNVFTAATPLPATMLVDHVRIWQ